MKKLNMQIAGLLVTIFVFVQLSIIHYIHYEFTQLKDTMHKENEALSDRIDKYDEQFSIIYGISFDSSQKIEDIEDMINDINQKIYEIIEEHNNSSTNNTESNESTESSDNDNIYDDWHDIYYGRLYVPNVNISVALYEGNKQAITDRTDSANIFTWAYTNGYTIADHNNQEFSKLFGVKIGTYGYIELDNGDVINMECVDVFDGYNTGMRIVDTSGANAFGRTDYMMYTCIDNWKNVRIWLWEITDWTKRDMKTNCYFDECRHCVNREYNNDLACCLSNRLGLAWHKLLLELPIINKFIDKQKFCYWFEKE